MNTRWSVSEVLDRDRYGGALYNEPLYNEDTRYNIIKPINSKTYGKGPRYNLPPL